jgi:hypothetical protein
MNDKLRIAQENLALAILTLDTAHSTWSECVTNMHKAELALRAANKHVRETFNIVADVINNGA